MADPATLTLIASGAAAAGTAATAVGSYQQGQSQANIAERNAELARRSADEQAQNKLLEARVMRSRQSAAYAGAGVDLTGSALDVISQTSSQYAKDALTLRYGGDIQAQALSEQAGMFRQQGTSQLIGGAFNTAGAAGKTYESYKNWKGAK